MSTNNILPSTYPLGGQVDNRFSPDHSRILNQLQQFRQNPISIQPYLLDREKRYKIHQNAQYLISKNYRKKAIEVHEQQPSKKRIGQLIGILLGQHSLSMGRFQPIAKLNEIAQKLCQTINPYIRNQIKFQPDTPKLLRSLLQQDPLIHYPNMVTCLVSLGFNQPYEDIMNLLIDDGVMDRGNRRVLLNPMMRYIGLATATSGKNNYLRCTIIVLTDQIVYKNGGGINQGVMQSPPPIQPGMQQSGVMQSPPPIQPGMQQSGVMQSPPPIQPEITPNNINQPFVLPPQIPPPISSPALNYPNTNPNINPNMPQNFVLSNQVPRPQNIEQMPEMYLKKQSLSNIPQVQIQSSSQGYKPPPNQQQFTPAPQMAPAQMMPAPTLIGQPSLKRIITLDQQSNISPFLPKQNRFIDKYDRKPSNVTDNSIIQHSYYFKDQLTNHNRNVRNIASFNSLDNSNEFQANRQAGNQRIQINFNNPDNHANGINNSHNLNILPQ